MEKKEKTRNRQGRKRKESAENKRPPGLGASWRESTGPVTIRMTNDFLFKMMLQKSAPVLRALICALLHMKPGQIRSLEIKNPIKPGESVEQKVIVLDVRVSINGGSVIDLEMQVVNYHDWPERSMYYTCRNFLNLNRGQPFKDVSPSIQIGFLDFSVFPKHPRFYATYKMTEIHEHYTYTDKFSIGVVDLTKIDLATEEDRAYNIDKWARLFKSETWEDIRMLAEQVKGIREAAETIYEISMDEELRDQAFAREDYLRRERGVQQEMEALTKENVAVRQENADLRRREEESRQALEERRQELEESRQELEESRQEIEESRQALEKSLKYIAELEARLRAQQ